MTKSNVVLLGLLVAIVSLMLTVFAVGLALGLAL